MATNYIGGTGSELDWCQYSGKQVAMMAGLAVFLGCFVHLLLDELSSFKLKFGFIPIPKKSSGSAFKFTSESLAATLFTYLILVAVGILAILSTRTT